ncbi:hypothetical protein OQA88_8272 [Cercophora sp. LCS_1]
MLNCNRTYSLPSLAQLVTGIILLTNAANCVLTSAQTVDRLNSGIALAGVIANKANEIGSTSRVLFLPGAGSGSLKFIKENAGALATSIITLNNDLLTASSPVITNLDQANYVVFSHSEFALGLADLYSNVVFKGCTIGSACAGLATDEHDPNNGAARQKDSHQANQRSAAPWLPTSQSKVAFTFAAVVSQVAVTNTGTKKAVVDSVDGASQSTAELVLYPGSRIFPDDLKSLGKGMCQCPEDAESTVVQLEINTCLSGESGTSV